MTNSIVLVRVADDNRLKSRIESHPFVRQVGDTSTALLEWESDQGVRSIVTGSESVEISGLVELMDNNPLVCASRAGVPDPASTLALVALGPAIRSGLLVESPVCGFSFESSSDHVAAFLGTAGWKAGVLTHFEPVPSDGVLVCSATVQIAPTSHAALQELYEEAFGPWFLLEQDRSAEWNPAKVSSLPNAFYRIEIMQDDLATLLTVKVAADRDGKCGSAQVVQTFNIMCGFEETLGID